jgi:hexosaminidase
MKAIIMPIISTLLLMAAAQVVVDAQVSRPALVPWPKKVAMRAGSFSFPTNLSIKVTGKDTEAVSRVAATLAVDLREAGFAAAVTQKKRVSSPKIVLGLSLEKSLGSEGYRIGVARDIRITAPTEQGLFWGTRTLLQLLAKGPGQPVSGMMILDKPEFGFRSLLIDTAREFHSIEFHRRTIKRLAQYKVNVYHIHFVDDQSWTLPSQAFPSLPTPGRHYTREELRDLVKLAAQYHVTIMPEIEMPGHSSALCASVPDVVCSGKQPRWMTCAGSERSFAALTTLVGEAMDIFPGPYIHIGADECDFSIWDGCPDCEAVKAREGLKDNEALYNRFINRMNGFIKSKGRKTVIWEGFKVGKEPIVDKDILVVEWNNKEALPADLMNAGYDITNSSSGSLYICRHWKVQAPTPQLMAEWNAQYFGGGYPAQSLDVMNKVTHNARMKGVGFCSWECEERSEDSMLFGIGDKQEGYADPAPRIQIMAERAWTGSSTRADDLLMRVGLESK